MRHFREFASGPCKRLADFIDVLIVGPTTVVPGAVVRCRPVGVVLMEDEAGPDEKIIAVPVDALHPFAGTDCSLFQPLQRP